MNTDSRIVINRLKEWLEAEVEVISDSEIKSHDHEEKIRLRAEYGILKKVMKKLQEYGG